MSDSPLSPASLRARIQQILLQLPPVQRADARYHEVEHELLHGLKHRLESLHEPGEMDLTPNSLHQLLDVSMEQSVPQAQAMLMQRQLANLTADEARLLAALSDGSAFPMLTVHSGGRFSRGEVLYRHSNVGRAAGIQCNDFIALYLNRLFAQGLVIASGFTEALRTDYELCEGDSGFRTAKTELETHLPKLSTRRETLRISPLGRQLWALMTTQMDVEE